MKEGCEESEDESFEPSVLWSKKPMNESLLLCIKSDNLEVFKQLYGFHQKVQRQIYEEMKEEEKEKTNLDVFLQPNLMFNRKDEEGFLFIH